MLICRDLSKRFRMFIRGGTRVVGFEGVDFNLREGDFLGVCGPSGIGKSSLLKCIYRTYLPSSGELRYTSSAGLAIDLTSADDHRILELRRTEISYVSQFFHVIPRISARDTLVKTMARRGVDREEACDIAESMLERFGIDRSLWNLFPSTFSGGEKQRMNILRAVVERPRLLLLDEPTASLDHHTSEIVISMLLSLKQSGTTMIGVFHDRDTMERLADDTLDFNRIAIQQEEAV